MVSTRPPTSKSFSPFSNPLVTVPNTPITIGIIVTCMFHSFFYFPSIFSVLFCGQPGQQSRQFCRFSSFCWLLLDLVFWPRLGDLYVCQSPIGVNVCYFLRQVLGSSQVHFKNDSEYLTRGLPCCLSLWWYFSCRTWFRETFSFVCGTFCYFFFLLCLLDDVRF